MARNILLIFTSYSSTRTSLCSTDSPRSLSFFLFFFFPIPSPVPSARIHVQRHERTCVVRTKRDRKFKARVPTCIRSMKYLDDRVRLCIATKGRYTLINGKIIFNRGPPPV